MNPRIPLLAAATVAAAVAAPAAEAAPKRASATYMVTLRAELASSWTYHDDSTIPCKGGACTRVTEGSGSAEVHVKTRRPFPMLVARGVAGRPPSLNLGSDGIPVTGSSLVQGTQTTDYAGPWEAGNPDTAEPVTGCGHRTIDDFASIGWATDGSSALRLAVPLEAVRDDCPEGPESLIEWEGGDAPSLGDVLARVGKGKFLGTKQFTVRGSRAWTGTVPGISRDDRHEYGSAEATWQWEATFRMKGGKRRR